VVTSLLGEFGAWIELVTECLCVRGKVGGEWA
jgi:hypothetical protein